MDKHKHTSEGEASAWREATQVCTTAAHAWARRLADTGTQLGNALGQAAGTRVEQWLGSERARRARAAAAEPRVVGWLRASKAPALSLKLRPVGLRVLSQALDLSREALVLTYGSHGRERDSHWMIGICDKRDIPPKAVQRGCLVQQQELLLIVPQKDHIADLNGRVLLVCGENVSIE